MKKSLTFILLLFPVLLFAQKAELSVFANGGLFNYTGIGTAQQSVIIVPVYSNNPSYTANPYGSKRNFSYGGGLQFKMVFKPGIIAGLQGGYDVLKSRVDINIIGVYTTNPAFTSYAIYQPSPNATGHTTLQSNYINLAPFIGYRVLNGKYKLDILPGLDIAYGLKSHENGTATMRSDGKVYTTDLNHPKPPNDIRLRLGIEAGFRKIAVMVSYAGGTRIQERQVNSYDDYKMHSRLLRFGLSYRLF